MHRLLSHRRVGTVLLASAAAASAEPDLNMLPVPDEVQSSAPAQPSAWSPVLHAAALETASNADKHPEAPGPGGAVFSPFVSSSQVPASANASQAMASKPPQTKDVPYPVTTLVAIAAAATVLAWLLRRG